MSPTKVAFVTPGSFPIPSSKSSSVERVVEKFVPLLSPVIEPRIYGRASRNLSKKGKVANVICERYPASNKAVYTRLVGQAIRRFAPQIIQVENRPVMVTRLKAAHPGKRLWLNLHSTTFIGPRYISRKALRKSLLASDKIIVNSEFIRGEVEKRVPEAARRLRVVYPGVDTGRFISRFSPEGAWRREEQRLLKGLYGRKVVIFIGRLIPLKGVHHLLHIVPQLAMRHPELLVVIVGSPFYGSFRKTEYSLSLERLARRCHGTVRFVPYVPHPEVADWFLSSDIAVVPSGQREAFGLVNVEAMACGIPVVATSAGGMKEIIVDGHTGFLINPDLLEMELLERLDMLLRDTALREDMGRNSRQLVEQKFTWRHTAEQWLNVLHE
ncbi:glycosyltransferase family 4 protein [Paenibacillus protaetiae]|uniref:Glycosyltransferase family 1 protein n=1 Tax=Paenibacillus protaetiae TaxID=2509456 RepID=A0A4P6ETT1_9BACL|nr:glycosyltransferase family 4 protein [Paenibacillus protaetiae]QAY66610.1 glycosyltransferase family 1 protein [Paenibacillus protaetiae]